MADKAAREDSTVMVPRHLRIKRAYRDPRRMSERSKEELVELAHWLGINTKGKTKEELATLLEKNARASMGAETRKAVIKGGTDGDS